MILFYQSLSFFLFIILIVGTFAIRNLLKKLEAYEEVVEIQQKYLQSISETIVEGREYINTLDEKGIFQSDDEVGIFFNGLKLIQQNLNNYTVEIDNAEKEKR